MTDVHDHPASPADPFGLFAEAERQLNICNSCRYCEGYCAVFPALERRTVLETGDITHLANLCHDCRACFHACMYAPPHEFAVNPPEILTRARRASYRTYVRPLPQAIRSLADRALPTRLRNHRPLMTSSALVLAMLLLLVAASQGIGALWRHDGPYRILAYPALVAVALVPAAWSVTVILAAAARYWRDTHGPLRDLAAPSALGSAFVQAARLSYLRGGGEDCYGDDAAPDPSPARRRWHHAVSYGFTASFASTVSAAMLQDIMGSQPPYPLLSVPVVLGSAGGVSMIAGCAGLAILKRRSGVPQAVSDYSLLIGLGLLAGTGMLTLLLRATPVYGTALVVHLATIVVCFGIAPYSTFVHGVYRFLALVQDNLERKDLSRKGARRGC